MDVRALDRGGEGLRAVRRTDGGGGELEGPGEVEVGAVGGGDGGVAAEQGVQGVVRAPGDREGEAGRLVRGRESGAEDAEDRTGGRVGDRSADGRAAGAQGVAPVGAERQLRAAGTGWPTPSGAVYVAGVVPSTLASRRPWAAMST